MIQITARTVCLIMTYGNLIKNKLQDIFCDRFDKLTLKSNLTDDQMECMQFGICSFITKKLEEIPYFHY